MKFSELAIGDKFIVWPDERPEEREREDAYYLFIKVRPARTNVVLEHNAISFENGNVSLMPKDMEVIKVT